MAYEKLIPLANMYTHLGLPTTLDDSLSYYEVLSKILNRLNELLENADSLKELIDKVKADLAQEIIDRENADAQLKEEIISMIEELRDTLTEMIQHMFISVKNPPNGLAPAVGDGTENDTEALVNIIAYAKQYYKNKAVVYFPPGDYRITSTLDIGTNTCLTGFSAKNSRIITDNSTNITLVQVGDNSALTDLSFINNFNSPDSAQPTVEITGTGTCVERVIIDGSGSGLDINVFGTSSTGSKLDVTLVRTRNNIINYAKEQVTAGIVINNKNSIYNLTILDITSENGKFDINALLQEKYSNSDAILLHGGASLDCIFNVETGVTNTGTGFTRVTTPSKTIESGQTQWKTADGGISLSGSSSATLSSNTNRITATPQNITADSNGRINLWCDLLNIDYKDGNMIKNSDEYFDYFNIVTGESSLQSVALIKKPLTDLAKKSELPEEFWIESNQTVMPIDTSKNLSLVSEGNVSVRGDSTNIIGSSISVNSNNSLTLASDNSIHMYARGNTMALNSTGSLSENSANHYLSTTNMDITFSSLSLNGPINTFDTNFDYIPFTNLNGDEYKIALIKSSPGGGGGGSTEKPPYVRLSSYYSSTITSTSQAFGLAIDDLKYHRYSGLVFDDIAHDESINYTVDGLSDVVFIGGGSNLSCQDVVFNNCTNITFLNLYLDLDNDGAFTLSNTTNLNFIGCTINHSFTWNNRHFITNFTDCYFTNAFKMEIGTNNNTNFTNCTCHLLVCNGIYSSISGCYFAWGSGNGIYFTGTGIISNNRFASPVGAPFIQCSTKALITGNVAFIEAGGTPELVYDISLPAINNNNILFN